MELVTTGKAVGKLRAKPTFVEIGGERRISTGKWNDDLMADHMITVGRSEWIAIGKLARIAYGAGTPKNKRLVRKRLRGLQMALMARRWLLLVDYAPPYGSASAVKIYDGESELDRQTLDDRLAALQEKGDLARNEYARAREIATIRDLLSGEDAE